MTDAIHRIDEFLFIVLGVVTLVDYLRHRDLVRRDTALFFGSLSVVVAANLWAGLRWDWLNRLLLVTFMLLPYLLLQVSLHVRTIPPRFVRYIQIGSLGFSIGMLLVALTSPVGLLFMGVAGLYFLSALAIPAILFLRAARTTIGAVNLRLRLIGSGTIVFGLCIVMVVGLTTIRMVQSSQLNEIESLWASFLGFISLGCFYVGFVPPRWLWRPLQISTLVDVIDGFSKDIFKHSFNAVLRDATRMALQIIGGSKGAIATVDSDGVHVTASAIDTQRHLTIDEAAKQRIRAVWASGSPTYVHLTDDQSDLPELRQTLEARTLFLVPVARGDKRWVVMVIGVQSGALFAPDDLHILRLFSEQIATLLENKNLVEKLVTVNEQLERKVAERTIALRKSEEQLQQRLSQLTAVNRELEAFSYSVSHDLRAPLRAINGFSQALFEDYGDQLAPEALEYLNRVRSASQRMGHQIDDMLKLSRVTRSEMINETVNLTAMAQRILDECMLLEPQRRTDITIQPKLYAKADPELTELLMENLLGNAWKFTNRLDLTRIEVGSLGEQGITVYYVRDNGVGFDPQYTTKLFTAFQRLHPVTEFEGNGIGLATVQRIVHRHGGRIWAEGSPGAGATFYFTLGPEGT